MAHFLHTLKKRIPCSIQTFSTYEPSVIAFLNHEDDIVLPQLQLVRFLRVVRVQGSVTVILHNGYRRLLVWYCLYFV